MVLYRLTMEPDDNGTLLVTSPDLPIATFGVDKADALRRADDAVTAILQSMMDAREEIAAPSFEAAGAEEVLRLPWQVDLKIQLYTALRAAGLTRADLQRRLGWQRESIDRLFRLRHTSRLEQIEQAFQALGKTVRFNVQDLQLGSHAA